VIDAREQHHKQPPGTARYAGLVAPPDLEALRLGNTDHHLRRGADLITPGFIFPVTLLRIETMESSDE
jgi:hypothetical protein